MSQYAQFEEKSRYEDVQPESSYQGGYTGPQPVSYTVNVPLQVQAYVSIPGQKLLVQDLNSGRGPGIGARLLLAFFSLVFVVAMIIVMLSISTSPLYSSSPIA